MKEHTVIVGAGQAGASAAAHLRELGYSGRISMLGREAHSPYQRPPLSKKFLSGEWPQERLLLRPDTFWSDNEIELICAKSVETLDVDQKTVHFTGGKLDWDKLVLATGNTPRKLSGTETDDRVHNVYSIRDVKRLKEQFHTGAHLAVIGGGYVGLEIAAVATQAGLDVTLIEQAERILGRAACAETATYFRQLHQENDVRLLEGVGVQNISVGAGDTREIELTSGETLFADLIVVGIGATPNVEIAQSAGLAIENGIKTQFAGRTSAPNVWAAGDCANFTYKGANCRLENVQNAVDMAEAVAKDICGLGHEYLPVPWFWSDQYDAKLQIAGLNTGFDRVISTTTANGLSNWYFKGRRMIAVDAVNDPRAYMAARKVLERNIDIEPARFTEADFQPMSLLA